MSAARLRACLGRRHQRGLAPRDPYGGQNSTVIGAGIDAEPVIRKDRKRRRRVAVDHYPIECVRRGEEIFANGHQVGFGLVAQGNAGPQAGMDEDQGVRKSEDWEGTHESHVMSRNRFTGDPQEILPGHALFGVALRIHSIGIQRVEPSDRHPTLQRQPTVHEGQHRRLVIACKANALEAWRRRTAQMLDDRCRVRTAIDIVAQHDDQLASIELRSVFDDLAFEREQLAIASMDVADRIDGSEVVADVNAVALPTSRRTRGRDAIEMWHDGKTSHMNALVCPGRSKAENTDRLTKIKPQIRACVRYARLCP